MRTNNFFWINEQNWKKMKKKNKTLCQKFIILTVYNNVLYNIGTLAHYRHLIQLKIICNFSFTRDTSMYKVFILYLNMIYQCYSKIEFLTQCIMYSIKFQSNTIVVLCLQLTHIHNIILT